MFGTKSYAKGIAKAQLRSFRMYQKQYPHMQPEQLYYLTLRSRPGYSETSAGGLVEDTLKYCSEKGRQFNLQEVILELAKFEYSQNHPSLHWEKRMAEDDKIEEVVRRIIPSNI